MANLGDSRAVACIHGAARQLTQVRHPGFAGGCFEGRNEDSETK